MNDDVDDGGKAPGPINSPQIGPRAVPSETGDKNPYVAPALQPPKRQKGSYAGILTAVVVFVGCLLAIIAWQVLRPRPALRPDLDYLSDDAIVIGTIDMNALRASAGGQKILNHEALMLDAISRAIAGNSNGQLNLADFGRMTVAVGSGVGKRTGIAHFNRAVSEKDVPLLIRGTKVVVGRYLMYVERDNAICQIDDRAIAVGDEESLRKILERDGPARFSTEIVAAIGEVDFSKAFVIAASLTNHAALRDAFAIKKMDSESISWLDGIQCGAFETDLSGVIRLKGVVMCKDAVVAERTKQAVEQLLALARKSAANLPSDAIKLLDSVQFSTAGSIIRATATDESDGLFSLMKYYFTAPERKPAPNP